MRVGLHLQAARSVSVLALTSALLRAILRAALAPGRGKPRAQRARRCPERGRGLVPLASLARKAKQGAGKREPRIVPRLAVPLVAAAVLVGSVTTAGIPPTQRTQLGPSTEYAGGTGRSGAQAMDVRDVDLDGFPDVVVANNEAESLSVYYGVGNGQLEPAQELVVDPDGLAFPAAVRIADIDGDRLPDLVVADDVSDALVVLLQRAERRAFDRIVVGSTPEEPVGLAVADFNADGAPDIVTANAGADPEAALTVFFQLATSRGQFLLGLNLASAPADEGFGGASAVVASDLDGDGVVDLAAANTDADSVGVLFGRGDGTFDPPLGLVAGRAPLALAVADFDIDGNPDIVAANGSDLNLSVFLGAGGRAFQVGQRLELPGFPEAVVARDFNADGRPDVAAVSATSEVESELFVFRGDGRGNFLGTCEGGEAPGQDCAVLPGGSSCGEGACVPDTFSVGGALPAAIAAGDMNRDRANDIAVANDESAEAALSILLNQARVTRGDSSGDGSVGAGDVDSGIAELFDGDGSSVITVGGGSEPSGPGVDANGDEAVTAADVVGIVDALREA